MEEYNTMYTYRYNARAKNTHFNIIIVLNIYYMYAWYWVSQVINHSILKNIELAIAVTT